MKIDLHVNNCYPKYNRSPMEAHEIQQVSLKHIKRVIKSDEHTYILRGEPTLHPNLYEILDALQGKNFIMTTSGYEPEKLIRYQKKIPYLVINYDGFINDKMRNHEGLTRNILRLLDHFGAKQDTTTRIQYTITKSNLKWIKADAEIIINFYALYPNLKKPYFIIYQQTEIYNQEVWTWVGIGKETVSLLNHKGLLSQKNLAYLNAWLDKEDYICTSPQTEMVMAHDGTFRMCQSMRYGEEIGNIEEEPLEEIIESTEDERKGCEQCAYRSTCWLAFHYKDSIANKKNI